MDRIYLVERPPSAGDRPKPKAKYTGERLLRERPRVYRKVVELLAEPREQTSIRQICRLCHVTDDTVKAVEKREAISIAARKQTLLSIALNVAQLSGERLEELAPGMNAREAGVNFGIATDKALLLSGDPTMRLEVEPGPGFTDLYDRINALHARFSQHPRIEAHATQPALPSCEIGSDSGAETGS